MSTAGKLFIVINLVLAALFVGSAASLIGTSNEWRSKYTDIENELNSVRTEKEAEVAKLNQEVQTQSALAQSQSNRLSQQEANNTALEQDILDERSRNTDLNESVSGIQSKLSDLESTNRQHGNRIAELENENRSLREERDGALDERDSALAAKTAAEQAQRTADGMVSQLRKELAYANDRGGEAEAKLASVVRMSGIDPSAVEGIQPDMEGVVLSTSYDQAPALVQINLGNGAKVLRGYSFDVYSGQSYKGRIKVEIVRANSSTCTVSLAGDAKIEAGDRIATNL
ncbi:MAG: hypothetical protein H8E31_14900 [Planctomycetes bacterium]|nr:hypothetical protein [Planctomycetota bacterium]